MELASGCSTDAHGIALSYAAERAPVTLLPRSGVTSR
ncbi:hypothetical protein AAur_pTC10053 (plasmid) [Paenarthrobacter aurescens TC1]|uniref:Uncharacterized protein n=1 Tax=Paenarthrobacter aurescens (strain TC1) TaxID=290340 RepID=A1RCG5_PAEAT|nr:hypothetical protein AAur_pTC10053 [Paenarthrobacter aurescens TC1]